MKAYQRITDEMIKLIEDSINGTWKQGWMNIEGLGIATNIKSNTGYRGINQMFLTLITDFKGFDLNRWMTYKQATDLGGNVKKGSKSYPVIYSAFGFMDPQTKKTYSETQVKNLPQSVKDRLKKFFKGNRYFNVFNVENIEGLDESYYKVEHKVVLKENFEKNTIAEDLMNNVGAEIKICHSNRAYYSPVKDFIKLPLREQFKGEEQFYKTAFHELVHWTGHESRLKRDLKGYNCNKKDYAFEELVAELGSVFIAAEFGFNADMTNNAEYLKSWLGCLKEDPEFLYKAAKKAQKASTFIIQEYKRNTENIAIAS